MAIVEARALRKTYTGDDTLVHALNGVDLQIGRGELLAVMGPSGSGKSTLLHVLGALDTPDEGTVRIGDAELGTLSAADLAVLRRRTVGFVFQFFNLVPILTVEENVALPAELDGVARSAAFARASAVLDELGMAGRRSKLLPSQLSGGEQQRVAIARALINSPDVVFADEPTGNLDRGSGREVMSLLQGINERGQTVVTVTHDPGVASYARRVVFMQDGRLVDEMSCDGRGDPEPVLTRLTTLERLS